MKNVHPIYGAGIRTHDLWNVSLFPQPLDQGSRPLFEFLSRAKHYTDKNYQMGHSRTSFYLFSSFQTNNSITIPGLFFIYFRHFMQTIQLPVQLPCETCPSSMRCWDLNPQPLCLLPQPLDQGSRVCALR